MRISEVAKEGKRKFGEGGGFPGGVKPLQNQLRGGLGDRGVGGATKMKETDIRGKKKKTKSKKSMFIRKKKERVRDGSEEQQMRPW